MDGLLPLFLETPTLTINVNYIFGLPPTQDSSHKNQGLGWDARA